MQSLSGNSSKQSPGQPQKQWRLSFISYSFQSKDLLSPQISVAASHYYNIHCFFLFFVCLFFSLKSRHISYLLLSLWLLCLWKQHYEIPLNFRIFLLLWQDHRSRTQHLLQFHVTFITICHYLLHANDFHTWSPGMIWHWLFLSGDFLSWIPDDAPDGAMASQCEGWLRSSKSEVSFLPGVRNTAMIYSWHNKLLVDGRRPQKGVISEHSQHKESRLFALQANVQVFLPPFPSCLHLLVWVEGLCLFH